MKRKYITLICLIVLGFFLSLTPIMILWIKNNDFNIVITILSSLGAGVLCSSIVSFIIEYFNESRLKRKIEQQRNFVLFRVKSELKHLLSLEFYNFSHYISFNDRKGKIERKEYNIISLSKDISISASIIGKDIENSFQNGIPVVDKRYQVKQNEKETYLCTNSISYYKQLKESIDYILSNKIILMSDIIEIEELNILNSKSEEISDIIRWSVNKDYYNYELLMEAKEYFYNELEDLIKILGIQNEIVKVRKMI